MPAARRTAAATATVLLNRLLARGKFRHMQVLLRLAELGSIKRTAEAIGTSQPAVTQSLAYLEELLETVLFERHARGVRPTPACAQLLPVVRKMMSGLEQGAEAIAAATQRGRGLVRLTASASTITGLLLQVLPDFFDRHAGIEIDLQEAEGEDLLLRVARGDTDLVACRRPTVGPEGWHFYPLLDDQLVVVASRSHPLARRRKPAWADLAGHPWVLPPAGSLARTHVDALAQEARLAPVAYPLITRVPTALWWVLRQRNALGFLPLGAVRHLVELGELVVLPLSPPAVMEPLGILAPAQPLSNAQSLLLDYLRERFAA